MNMIKILLCCLALLLSASPLLGVDGYKNLKFGMSPDEIKKTDICGWIDDGSIKIQHTRVIYCLDLKFNNELTMAGAYFINNKFLRLVLQLSENNINSALIGLRKKYGVASDAPSAQSIEKFKNQPNQEFWLLYGFDKNTVRFLYKSDQLYKKSAALIYTSPLFDKLLKEKQADSIKDDL